LRLWCQCSGSQDVNGVRGHRKTDLCIVTL
jgi:hypothetical protein